MAHDLSRILVVDLEATCWDGEPPPAQVADVIELGWCVVGTRPEPGRGERGTFLVRPERSTVGACCTGLTSITPEMVAGAPSLEAVLADLRARVPRLEQLAWASYGDYDRRLLERSAAELRLRLPFGPTHLNVKHLFALAWGLDREVGMDEALRLAGEDLVGTHHRGGDDAWNVALLLVRCLHRLQSARGGRPPLPEPPL
jgi:inhibitor of KinA sporulation pathway (predicted exonuclease)